MYRVLSVTGRPSTVGTRVVVDHFVKSRRGGTSLSGVVPTPPSPVNSWNVPQDYLNARDFYTITTVCGARFGPEVGLRYKLHLLARGPSVITALWCVRRHGFARIFNIL